MGFFGLPARSIRSVGRHVEPLFGEMGGVTPDAEEGRRGLEELYRFPRRDPDTERPGPRQAPSGRDAAGAGAPTQGRPGPGGVEPGGTTDGVAQAKLLQAPALPTAA